MKIKNTYYIIKHSKVNKVRKFFKHQDVLAYKNICSNRKCSLKNVIFAYFFIRCALCFRQSISCLTLVIVASTKFDSLSIYLTLCHSSRGNKNLFRSYKSVYCTKINLSDLHDRLRYHTLINYNNYYLNFCNYRINCR